MQGHAGRSVRRTPRITPGEDGHAAVPPDFDGEAEMDEKRRLRWIVVLTGIGSFMAALDTLVVASALNTIQEDLGASLTDLEWTVNAYNLSLAVLLVPAAVLGDRLGRARTYAAGLAFFALTSAGAALAGSVGVL